jgi:hypothetical protein
MPLVTIIDFAIDAVCASVERVPLHPRTAPASAASGKR